MIRETFHFLMLTRAIVHGARLKFGSYRTSSCVNQRCKRSDAMRYIPYSSDSKCQVNGWTMAFNTTYGNQYGPLWNMNTR